MFRQRRPTRSPSNRIAYKMRATTTNNTRLSSSSSSSASSTTTTRSSVVGHSTTTTTFLGKIAQAIRSMFVVCRLLLTEWYLRTAEHLLLGNVVLSKWPMFQEWTTTRGGGAGGGAKRRKRKRKGSSDQSSSGDHYHHPSHAQQHLNHAQQNWPNPPLPLARLMPFDSNNNESPSSSSSSSRSLCSGLDESIFKFDDDDHLGSISNCTTSTTTSSTPTIIGPEDSAGAGMKSMDRRMSGDRGPADDAQSRDRPIMDQVDLRQPPLPQQPQQQRQQNNNNQDDNQDDDSLLAARERRFRITEKQFTYLKHKIEKLLVRLESEYETEIAASPDEECVICISAKATMQTYPCGHRVVCRRCFVKTIQMVVSQRMLPLRCVICRAKVLRLKQITSVEYANCFSSFGTTTTIRSSSSSSSSTSSSSTSTVSNTSNSSATNGNNGNYSSTNSITNNSSTNSITNNSSSNNLFPPKTNIITHHSRTERVVSQLAPEIYTIDVTKNERNRSKPTMTMVDNNNTSSTTIHHQQYTPYCINPFKWLNQNTNNHHDHHHQFQPKFNRTNANNNNNSGRLIRTNLNNNNNIQPRCPAL